VLIDRDVIGFGSGKRSLSMTGENNRRNKVRCP